MYVFVHVCVGIVSLICVLRVLSMYGIEDLIARSIGNNSYDPLLARHEEGWMEMVFYCRAAGKLCVRTGNCLFGVQALPTEEFVLEPQRHIIALSLSLSLSHVSILVRY